MTQKRERPRTCLDYGWIRCNPESGEARLTSLYYGYKQAKVRITAETINGERFVRHCLENADAPICVWFSVEGGVPDPVAGQIWGHLEEVPPSLVSSGSGIDYLVNQLRARPAVGCEEYWQAFSELMADRRIYDITLRPLLSSAILAARPEAALSLIRPSLVGEFNYPWDVRVDATDRLNEKNDRFGNVRSIGGTNKATKTSVFVNQESDDFPLHRFLDGSWYLFDYHPKKVWNEVRRNNQWGYIVTQRVLQLKERDPDAIQFFYEQLNPWLSEGFSLAVVPSSEPSNRNPGIRILAQKIASGRGRIDATSCLVRMVKIQRLSGGGNRSVQTHLQSIQVIYTELIEGYHVVLLDDVRTTGNSLSACATLLQQRGAVGVTRIALAKTVAVDARRFC